MKSIVIWPVKGCKRSRKILEYLDTNHIPYQRIDLDSAEDEEMMKKYQFLASPGILINGVKINPYDVLISPSCKVNEKSFNLLIGLNGE